MEFNEILQKLDKYIRDNFEIGDDPDYNTHINLFDYGFIDSLGATEIVLYIEENFGCKITQKDITLYPMNSVEEIARVVETKLK